MKLFVPKLIPDLFETLKINKGVFVNNGQLVEYFLQTTPKTYSIRYPGKVNYEVYSEEEIDRLELQLPILQEYVSDKPVIDHFSTIRKPNRGGRDEYLERLKIWEKKKLDAKIYLVKGIHYDWFYNKLEQLQSNSRFNKFIFGHEFEVLEYDDILYRNTTKFSFISGTVLPKNIVNL